MQSSLFPRSTCVCVRVPRLLFKCLLSFLLFFSYFLSEKENSGSFFFKMSKKFVIENITDPDEDIEVAYRCWKFFYYCLFTKSTHLSFFMTHLSMCFIKREVEQVSFRIQSHAGSLILQEYL
jgi:hypothetical protein